MTIYCKCKTYRYDRSYSSPYKHQPTGKCPGTQLGQSGLVYIYILQYFIDFRIQPCVRLGFPKFRSRCKCHYQGWCLQPWVHREHTVNQTEHIGMCPKINKIIQQSKKALCNLYYNNVLYFELLLKISKQTSISLLYSKNPGVAKINENAITESS